MKNRKTPIMIIYVVILLVVFSWMLGIFGDSGKGLTYSQVVAMFNQEKVRSFTVEGGTIYLELHGSEDVVVGTVADADSFRREMWDTIQAQSEAGVLESYNFQSKEAISPYDFILPIILAGGVLLILWMLLVGRANAKNPMADFGKARTVNGSNQKVMFADVAGVDEEKAELQEVVDFLRNPQKFTDIGAKIPHGILLSGAPGTGKTMLAKAVAGEAGVPFLSISGSDFMEMYVGVGASRVRDLFQQAKKEAPAIIFIDEIDAVGRKRGSGLGGGHDEREQTLNQLLVEMDGFERTEGVIVLAATNRPDILDPALLRPGRFDRQVYVNKPDVKGREAILKVHAKNKRLDDTVDLHLLARSTVGFTGADLSNLLNEAAILAAREDRKMLSMEDLNNAMMKIMAGPEKRSHLKNRKDLKETAIHEAGHAVAMYHLPTQDKVLHVTIIPRGRSLGATWHLPKDDASNMTRNEMYEEIVSLLGGRVAEALFVGDISVGASNDIDRATKLAREMVGRYGMCERIGTVSYLGGDELFIGRDYQSTKGYSEKVAATMDDEVKILIDKAYAHCKQILEENADKLHEVVAFLLENESMTGAQFADCMEGKNIRSDADVTLFDSFKEEN